MGYSPDVQIYSNAGEMPAILEQDVFMKLTAYEMCDQASLTRVQFPIFLEKKKGTHKLVLELYRKALNHTWNR
jgi:hypothetical protein